jgi:hypothetical protein
MKDAKNGQRTGSRVVDNQVVREARHIPEMYRLWRQIRANVTSQRIRGEQIARGVDGRFNPIGSFGIVFVNEGPMVKRSSSASEANCAGGAIAWTASPRPGACR